MDQQKAFLNEWHVQNFPLDTENANKPSQLRKILFEFEEAIKKTLQVEEACVVVPDTAIQNLRYATCDVTFPIQNDGGSIILECYYTQQRHIISHARRSALYRQKIDNPQNIRAEHIMVLPLIDGDKTIAVLRIATTQEKQNFTLDDAAIVEEFFAELTQPVLAISNPNSDENPLSQLPEKASPDASSEHSLPVQETNITVLAIDDSTIILRLLQNFLLDFNAHVLVATSGAEGIELFTTNRIDLIFMDEIMDSSSGHETIEEIRAIEEKAQSKPVPILGLTTDDSSETKDRMIRSGATEVLYKPILHSTVHSAIRKYTNV